MCIICLMPWVSAQAEGSLKRQHLDSLPCSTLRFISYPHGTCHAEQHTIRTTEGRHGTRSHRAPALMFHRTSLNTRAGPSGNKGSSGSTLHRLADAYAASSHCSPTVPSGEASPSNVNGLLSPRGMRCMLLGLRKSHHADARR